MPETKGSVLYVGGFEMPDRNPAAHRVLNNARILRTLGYTVVFCGVDKEIQVAARTPDDVDGFASYPIPYPTSTKQWIHQMTDISAYVRLIEAQADLQAIFCYNLHAVPLAKLLKVAKKRGIPVISDCTEWYENKLSLNPLALIKCVDTYLCMRHYQKKCDGMITISSYLAEYYRRYIPHMAIVPPLVDLTDAKYQPSQAKCDVPTLVYSGSPSASKEALGEVVRCLNNIRDLDFKLTVVGVTKEQFCDIYGIEPDLRRMEFLGRVSHEKALETVKTGTYSVIIRPKARVTMAGFPTKFAEAISCGTAVIANDISDLAQYLKNGNNGHLIRLECLEQQLREILSQKELPVVERECFDYRQYVDVVRELLYAVNVN